MRLAYDYSDFLYGFADELESGALTLKDYIYIIRQQEPICGTYCPIIDWYYLDTLQYAIIEDDKYKAVKVKLKIVIDEMERWTM
ncbi:hypothetical protein [Vagococcus acidifermentans]|uniref:Uncharacterized protein n=1 Tax=Vagococcus acidifermentans TaxID=564710 RepID=A0A430AQ88_9ENTE|nr:hypothetical protein [Vagococcus acidifermentans]RSU10104.1 hypothetical protein CBF27_11305 [Vagococcus acidifermentans]